jgi:hypothetical protein
MIKPLEYYFVRKESVEHVVFNKYTIDEDGIIRNDTTRKVLAYTKNKAGYYSCSVTDNNGKQRSILIGRAIVSTFEGLPPSSRHTADHVDRQQSNDNIENIRWLCKKGQGDNRVMPEVNKTAIVIVKDGIEKTVKQWDDYLKDMKNHMGRNYTKGMLNHYAQKRQFGFSYKEYPDIPGEVWKKISGSENTQGRWEISDMNRVKYITKYAENVFYEERLGLKNGYPKITINGKDCLCHILSFMSFFPEQYAMKKVEEMVLHEDDDRLDFRPHKLRLGSQHDNTTDAHDNGKYGGKKSERMRCVSYINDVYEKEHHSQEDGAKYLKSLGYTNATHSSISRVLSGNRKTAYGRTWKLIE